MYQRTKHANRIAALLAASVAVTGCSSLSGLTEGLRMLNPFGSKVSFVMPPQEPVLHNYRTVAVANESDNAYLYDAVYQLMAEAPASRGNYFDAVSRSQQGGKSEVLVTITGSAPSATTNNFAEERIQCPGSGVVRTCNREEGRIYKVSCTERVLTMSGAVSAADAKTRRSLLNRSESVAVKDKVCSDSNSQLRTDGQLAAQAGNELAVKLIGAALPVKKERPSDLVTEIDGYSDDDNRSLELAEKLAEEGNISVALERLESLKLKNGESAPLVFNIGFLNHALGNYQTANENYKGAVSLGMDAGDVETYLQETDLALSSGLTSITR